MAEERKGEALLLGLAGIAAKVAERDLGIPSEVAKVLADEIATEFSQSFGGFYGYIPKGRVFRTSSLYRRVWEGFNGKNQVDLAREFQVSIVHLYRILARERERDRAERQRGLPGVPESP